jgi:PncC family amidohydrolase
MQPAEETLLQTIHEHLIKHHLTIATAESCTGGLIAHTLTNTSGSSAYFDRGIVSYSNRAKMELLNVSEELLITHGAVSEPVAKAMAEGVRANAQVDLGIATTGIAGPTGGTKEKPVGLVYIAVATPEKTQVKRCQFHGTRLQNKQSTLLTALQMLHDILASEW